MARVPTEQASFGVVVAPLMFVELFSGVLQAYFAPLYPELSRTYHVSAATMSWSLTGWSLALAVFTPLLSKTGDVYGHRRVLHLDVALVAAGTVVVALAHTFPVLMVGRVLQGALAAYLPLMFGLARSNLSVPQTRRSVAYLSSVVLFGALVGTVGISVFTKYLASPTWALWVPAVGTCASWFALRLVPRTAFERRHAPHRVDWGGAALLAGGLVGILLGVSEGPGWGWGSPPVIAAGAGGVVLLAGWIALETRATHPLIDLRHAFRARSAPVHVIGFCIYFGFLGGQAAISTFLGLPRTLGGLGLDAFGISMAFGAVYLVSFAATAGTARLGSTVGYPWATALGCLIGAAGFASLSLFHRSAIIFVCLFSLAGLGNGLIEGSTRVLIIDNLKPDETAIGEGLYELFITTGAALGSAASGAVLSSGSARPVAERAHGYALVWTTASLLCLAAAGVAVGLAFFTRRGSPPQSHAGQALPAHL